MNGTLFSLGEQMLWVQIPQGASGDELAEIVHRSLNNRPGIASTKAIISRISLLPLYLSDGETLRYVTLMGRDNTYPVPAVCEIELTPASSVSDPNWNARHLGGMFRQVGRTQHTAFVSYEAALPGMNVRAKFRVAGPGYDFDLLRDSEELMNDVALRQKEG